jgi:RNA polymerase sigma factor (TIGR02999 family)
VSRRGRDTRSGLAAHPVPGYSGPTPLPPTDTDLSALLAASRQGHADAFAEAFSAAYNELHRLARRQLRHRRSGQTLTPTALVHEAFLKLVRRPVVLEDQTHFFALAARAMRQILVDYARAHCSQKRNRGFRATTLDEGAEGAIAVDAVAEDLIGIDRALGRLELLDERLAQIVEWRFFGGMTEEEIARNLNVTPRTIRRDWQKARAFLYRELHAVSRP